MGKMMTTAYSKWVKKLWIKYPERDLFYLFAPDLPRKSTNRQLLPGVLKS